MNKKNQNIRTGHMTKIITHKLSIFHLTTTPIFYLLSTSFWKQQSDLLIVQFHSEIISHWIRHMDQDEQGNQFCV
jgi:hypothetical protein